MWGPVFLKHWCDSWTRDFRTCDRGDATFSGGCDVPCASGFAVTPENHFCPELVCVRLRTVVLSSFSTYFEKTGGAQEPQVSVGVCVRARVLLCRARGGALVAGCGAGGMCALDLILNPMHNGNETATRHQASAANVSNPPLRVSFFVGSSAYCGRR